MRALRGTSRILGAGLGIALVSTLAFLAGTAQAQYYAPMPETPPGSYGICTISGATWSGREWAALMPARPGYCTRLRLGGPAPTSVTHCGALARSIGCIVVN
jgi:hypothetical protein